MLVSSYSMTILAYIFFVYVLCGVIKGSIGFGMPTVSISLLSFVLDVKIIIALILVPTLVVNIYQLSRGGNLKKLLVKQIFLFFSTIFIFPGAYLLKIINSKFIILFIATILIINSALFLFKIKFKLPFHDKPFPKFSWINKWSYYWYDKHTHDAISIFTAVSQL